MKPCANCGEPGWKIVTYFVGLTQHRSSFPLCESCYSKRNYTGKSGGIPNAQAKARGDANAAAMQRRDTTPLVSGVRKR